MSKRNISFKSQVSCLLDADVLNRQESQKAERLLHFAMYFAMYFAVCFRCMSHGCADVLHKCAAVDACLSAHLKAGAPGQQLVVNPLEVGRKHS